LVVRILNVTKSFGKLRAVDNLSLDIEQGEFLTLLGPSGCGKTTTLRLISGFETPDSGSIFLEDADVSSVPPFRRNVNTVFQSYALFPHMTIFDNVAYGLVLKKLSKSVIKTRVMELLERVGLAEKAHSLPRQLSGGQMQRIALIRALINEPKVLLLDEPLGALDAKLRKAMQIELKHVHERLGITFVYVTHDQEEALVMSDRIAVMDKGSIAQLGSPEDIYSRPKSEFVADFVGTSNFIRGRAGKHNGDGPRTVIVEGCGELQVPLLINAGTDAPVTLGIRSHNVKISPAQDGTATPANAVTATIEEVIYAGAMVKLVLKLADGQTLLLEDLSDTGRLDRSSLQTGLKLKVELNPLALIPFTGSSG